jgi:hypothetical protein
MRIFRSVCLSTCLGLAASACGDGGSSSDPGTTDGGAGNAADAAADAAAAADASVDFAAGPLLPLTIGSRWTYRVTDADGTVSEKTLTASAKESVGGDGPNAATSAVKLVADRGTELTYSWVGASGDKAVRYREQVLDSATLEVKTEDVWDPSRIYVDGSADHRSEGASWLEVYNETSTNVKKATAPVTAEVRERWTVISAAESVTVPAGTFTAIVFQKAGATKLKQYWYVPGVGKIKETGGQTEELSDYQIAK